MDFAWNEMCSKIEQMCSFLWNKTYENGDKMFPEFDIVCLRNNYIMFKKISQLL